jgi:Asp-tRNA(Asn)/Glu-tRNA(Gln) amidotransferase A subunit family amidase
MTDTPNENSSAESDITAEVIAGAERLLGLTFADGEREMMLEASAKKVAEYDQLRSVPLDNGVPPVFLFDPRPARARGNTPIRRQYTMSQQPPVERPATLDEAAFYPVTQLAELIRTRQVTSVELTEMYLARLERYNAGLECVITLTADLAMRQAKQADADLAQGHYRGPLHGIPWGAKDLLAARGYPTTWGAQPYREQILDSDATVVERLADAGAVLVAKLSLGELAHGDQWFGGKTKNPWNIQEGSGGSSAGPAAATGAGLVGFAIGSETTGSIVWPALRCGVCGVRPTFGLVPRYGAMILSWTLDKLGPIARTVEDCALVLSAIYGPDGKDPFAIDAPFRWEPDLDIRRLRVGYLKSAFETAGTGEAGSYETVKPLRKLGIDLREHPENDNATLRLLERLGVELVPIELPTFPLDAMLMILNVEAAAAFDTLTRADQDDMLVGQDKDGLANRLRQARFIPAVEYIQANRVRSLLVEAMAELFNTIDVFVTPQLGGNNLTLTNLTGHPCVGVPNGFTDAGMPTGINFVGKPFGEASLLAVARAVQNATDFHLRRPALDWEAGDSFTVDQK